MKGDSMKPKQFHWGWVSFTTLFAFLLGCLFHSVYSLLGENVFVGLFFPMNESVWEHLKLCLYPLAITWLIFLHRMRQDPEFRWPNRLTACSISVAVSCLIITGSYYLLYAGFRLSNIYLNFATYALGLFLGQWLAVHLTFQRRFPKWPGVFCGILLGLLILGFACLSLQPLDFPIFWSAEP